MDLDKIRKINELAKNLQKHNFAINSLDATETAKEIFEERKPEVEVYQQPTQNETQPTENTGSALLERRYQLLLEQNNQKFTDEIKQLKETVDSLSFQVLNLRSEIVKINSSQRTVEKPQEIPQVQQTNIEQPIQQQTQQQSPQPTQTFTNPAPLPEPAKKEPHPRQGNYTSNDVAIDKFFYFGRKKV